MGMKMARFFTFTWLAIASSLGLACLAIAAAALRKSHDPLVIQNGFQNDYFSLAAIMGGLGALFVIVATVGLVSTLRRKPTLPPPADHF